MSDEASDDAVRVHLEIERGRDPIQGRFVDPAGRIAGFRGWLELSSALEVMRLDGVHDTDEEDM